MSDPETGATAEQAAGPQGELRVPYWDYVDLAAFFGAAIPCLLLAGLIVRGLCLLIGLGVSTRAAELLASQFLGYALWFAFLYVMLRLRYGLPFWRSLGMVPLGGRFWIYPVAGVAVAFGVSAVGMLLGTRDIDSPMMRLLSDRTAVLLIGLAAATVGPVCEEAAFRGFMMPLLVRSAGALPGIILSALPFALLHGPQYSWSWRHIVLVALAGSAFGYTRWRTGSTAAAAVVHAAYNATFFTAYLMYGKDLPAKW
jgi:membrane protease YdiL (CAAX protease family)